MPLEGGRVTHWMLGAINETRENALRDAARVKIFSDLAGERVDIDCSRVERSAQVLEMAVMDMLSDPAWNEDPHKVSGLRSAAADAYRLYRVLPARGDQLKCMETLVRMSCLAVLGDQGQDVARHLRGVHWDHIAVESDNWSDRTYASVLDVWLRLIRKEGWADRDRVLERVAGLRESQRQYEAEHLGAIEPEFRRSAALRLVSLYHLARAAEILALYVTEGRVEGSYQVGTLLDMQFDRSISACSAIADYEREPVVRLLAATARQLVDNAIWTVTRAVNSRVTRFVESLVARGRGSRAIFDVLPPQRIALAEQGLLGSSRRAVVVSLPTSSGKTLIAQFRILQALNQYDVEGGWVAYLAPTRTLVRQVARRLRQEFAPLNVPVEQVSPALEVDSVDAGILRAEGADGAGAFRVLVTTPEKLDLMLRQGWEEKVGRPLTLVVVDEAHNIQDESRGLKLELLLSTINAECQRAQFLLLTPFIENAREVARWLGGQNSDDVSLSVDWQPNDRVIGIAKPVRGQARGSRNSFGCSIVLEPVHTSRKTLATEELISIAGESACGTFSATSNPGEIAAQTAAAMSDRGPVIVMHSTPSNVWSLADKIKRLEPVREVSDNVALVQRFLKLEMGDEFPLVELLSRGIGVHHAGLSDDVRALMEWLFEQGDLSYLVATTTIAQGVNFPVSGVVMAATQHWRLGVGQEDMSPADFWNIAGRAGRVDQGAMGVVAIAAASERRVAELRGFVDRQTGSLNSSLSKLVEDAGDLVLELGGIVYAKPEWSSFLQYLAHTYGQMDRQAGLADQVEQVLRGTFGFGKLRSENPAAAIRLLSGVRAYIDDLSRPNQPLKLVDSTGFSLQSIKTAMINARAEGVTRSAWNKDRLFSPADDALARMMGVLLRVPELRRNLEAVTGGASPNGRLLSDILKDWVGGCSVPEIASRHFSSAGASDVEALTKCGRNLYGRLTQTAAWGLGALLSITAGEIEESEREELNGLASKAFYGVSSDEAVALRLLGVPRLAAEPIAQSMRRDGISSPAEIRAALRSSALELWQSCLGEERGLTYMRVWEVLEGGNSSSVAAPMQADV